MNSVKKYGNVSVSSGIGFPNKISSTIIVDSNEITLSDTGISEQISLEIKIELTFNGSDNNIFKGLSNIKIEQVASYIVLGLLLIALAAYSPLHALGALLLFIIKPK